MHDIAITTGAAHRTHGLQACTQGAALASDATAAWARHDLQVLYQGMTVARA